MDLEVTHQRMLCNESCLTGNRESDNASKGEIRLKYGQIIIGTKSCYEDDPVLALRSPLGVPLKRLKVTTLVTFANMPGTNGMYSSYIKECLKMLLTLR